MTRGIAPGLVLSGLLACAHAPAWADDKDLDLIPKEAEQAAPPVVAPGDSAGQKIYLGNVYTHWWTRAVEVPNPSQTQPAWLDRLFVDARKEWNIGDKTNAVYSGRLSLRAGDGISFPTDQNIRHDFREAFLDWELPGRGYLDLGRVNLKSGVATGYNPTDFFKTRTIVEPLSADPSVLRDDRLGTFMIRGSQVFKGGAVTAAFAPKLYDQPSAIYPSNDIPSFKPMFDRTNAQNRVLLKASRDLLEDVNAEGLIYSENGRTQFGANFSKGIGQSVVAYLEWAGGTQSSLIDQALRYGRETGTLPVNAPSVLTDDQTRHFQNQVATGASYTTASKLTLNLEYFYNQIGFSEQDWRVWFNAGRAAANIPVIRQQLWYIRGYALDQQQLMSRHYAFLRVNRADAFIRNLELTGLATFNLRDHSSFAQVTASYYASDHWTVRFLAGANIGKEESEFGSLPQQAYGSFQVLRYF